MPVTPVPGDDLILEFIALPDRIRAIEFPALYLDAVTDDGETFVGLRCPRCGQLVDDDSLTAVDMDLRHAEMDGDVWTAIDEQTFTFSAERGDYESTIYYRHNDDHAVALPEGWGEDWT